MSEQDQIIMAVQQNEAVHPAISWAHEKIRTTGVRVAAATLAGALMLGACAGSEASDSTTTTTLSAKQFEANETCPDTWEVPGVDHGEANRWFVEGITAIKEAQTDEDARNASIVWIDGSDEHLGIKHDTNLMVSGFNIFKAEATPALTAEELTDENGCATPKMIQAMTDLEATIAASKVTPAEAPETGYNTGTDAEGNVVIASQPGVSGDRKAIKIVTPDGKEIYILARCGQPVLPGQPTVPLPEGPTDNPVTPGTTVTTAPEGSTTTITIPMKHDDGRLPGNPEVPADQDRGTPDVPGTGPVGQTPGPDGYVPGETRPTAPDYTPPTQPRPTTTVERPTATTSPQPTNTQPPVSVTTPPTSTPQTGMPVAP